MEGYCSRPKVSILGCGNVAYHLAPALADSGVNVEVWSRNFDHSSEVSEKSESIKQIISLDDISRDSDFYIITVSDDAIPEIAERLKPMNTRGIVAHTSGSYQLEKLSEILNSDNTGVFYPLQTFSKNSNPDIKEVPFFIEGSSPEVTEQLIELASRISNIVKEADSTARGHLHVAAVFANNFANCIWGIADEYLENNLGMNISVFEPLLKETLRKAMTQGPKNSQTGPAKRGDIRTIEEHISKLGHNEAEIYKLLSSYILKHTEQ